MLKPFRIPSILPPLAAVAALFAVMTAGHALAAPAPSFTSSTPNIWGIWMGVSNTEGDDPRFRSTPWSPNPQFTPAGLARSKIEGDATKTPGECDPWGAVNYMAAVPFFPLEIAPTTTGLVILLEATVVPRRIYADGRGHPDDLDPTWLGHSVARWEGDTLVVDTVGTNGRTRPINGYVSGAVFSKVDTAPRLPVSDQLHLVERMKLVGNGDYLEDQLTITDPKYYLQPFTAKHYWRRRPDLDVLEYVCTDNKRPDSEGQTQ